MGDLDKLAGKPRVVIDTCVLLRAMYDRVYPETPRAENATSFNALALARRDYAICFTIDTRDEAIYMISSIRRGPIKGWPMRNEERLQFVQKYIEPFSIMVPPAPSSLKCRDAKDQMFLEAATGAGAQYVISTDKDLLVLKHDGLCQIVLPEQFNREERQRIREAKLSKPQAPKLRVAELTS